MVQTTVRPALDAFFTARMTREAARASSPEVGSLWSRRPEGGGWAGGGLLWQVSYACWYGRAIRSAAQLNARLILKGTAQHSTAQHSTAWRALHEDDRWVGHQLHRDGQPLALLRAEVGAGQADQRAGNGVQLNQAHLL